jgi:hypothetical protein
MKSENTHRNNQKKKQILNDLKVVLERSTNDKAEQVKAAIGKRLIQEIVAL